MIDDPEVTEDDLNAYVDGQLGANRQMAVERYLGQHPAAAARVMSDLSIRHALRLTRTGDVSASRPETREMARRLEAAFVRQAKWLVARRVAAAVVLVAGGWFASTHLNPFSATAVNASVHPPAHVEEAVRAHRTAQVREKMVSQPETSIYDPDDIRASTGIVLPAIPADWKIVDVQIFPSQFGPSVEMSLVTEDQAHVSLFATRPGYFAVEPLQRLALSEADAAYWQIGEVAYALVSDPHNRVLSSEAQKLFQSLY